MRDIVDYMTDEVRSANDDIKIQADKLRRKILSNTATQEDLVRMADFEFSLGKRESSARLLLKALIINPKAVYPRQIYTHRFSEVELKTWDLRVAPVPVNEDWLNILKYPLVHNRWVALLVLAISFKLLSFIPFLPLVIFFLLLEHYSRHMYWAATGIPGEPGVVTLDLSYIRFPLVPGFFYLSPAIVLLSLKSGYFLTSSVFLAGLYLFPMACLASCIYQNIGCTFDFPLLFRSITRISKEYHYTQCLYWGIYIFYALFFYLDLPWFSQLPVDFIALYALTVAGRITGKLYYVNQTRLNWLS